MQKILKISHLFKNTSFITKSKFARVKQTRQTNFAKIQGEKEKNVVEFIEESEKQIETTNKIDNDLFDKEDEVDEQVVPFDKDKIKFLRETLLYKGDDPYYDKAVQRPQKGVIWGLGGQLMKRRQNFFRPGQWPNPEEIQAFLELEQASDIVMIDAHKELNRHDLAHYIIICSAFSTRHNYKIASSLLQAVKKLNIPNQTKKLEISGRKDDEWTMVDIKDVAVHIFNEEARNEMDLEYKLRSPPSQEMTEKFNKIQNIKKRKQVFEPIID